MEEKLRLLIRELGEIRVKEKINLADYTYLKLNITAEALFVATTTRELIKAVELCQELKIDYLIIGSGSKLVYHKPRFSGLIIKNRGSNLKIFGIKGKASRSGLGVEEALIEADSGVTLIELGDYTSKQGLGGFEDIGSSVGTIGGSILSNQTLRDKVSQVKVFSAAGEEKMIGLSKMSEDDVVLSVIFSLKAKNI